MITADELYITLVDVLKALEELDLKFHLTGGLVSSFYGEPRLTQDIDIVIKINAESISTLVICLTKNFLIDPLSIEESIKSRGIFQALHNDTMIKIDFHVGEAIFGELNRSVIQEILPGLVAPIVTVEDAILSKLIWIKKGSQKSRQDVRMMLKIAKNIDLDNLSLQSSIYEVDEILKEILIS